MHKHSHPHTYTHSLTRSYAAVRLWGCPPPQDFLRRGGGKKKGDGTGGGSKQGDILVAHSPALAALILGGGTPSSIQTLGAQQFLRGVEHPTLTHIISNTLSHSLILSLSHTHTSMVRRSFEALVSRFEFVALNPFLETSSEQHSITGVVATVRFRLTPRELTVNIIGGEAAMPVATPVAVTRSVVEATCGRAIAGGSSFQHLQYTQTMCNHVCPSLISVPRL